MKAGYAALAAQSLRAFLASPTRVFMLVELGRVGGLFLTSLLLGRALGLSPEVARFEKGWLLLSSLTFAPLWALTARFNAVYPAANVADKSHVLAENAFFSGLTGAAAALAVVLAGVWGQDWAWAAELAPFAFYVFGATFCSVLEYYLLAERRLATLLVGGWLWYAAPLAAFGGSVWLTGKAQSGYAVLAAAAALRTLFFVFLLKKNAAFGDVLPRATQTLRQLSPLVGATLVAGSAGYVDAYLIQFWTTDAEFTLFRYGARELPLTLALANALSARLVQLYAQNQANLAPALAQARRSSARLTLLNFGLTGLLLVSSAALFYWLRPDGSFMSAVPVFNLYLLLVVPRMLFPRSVLLGLQHNRALFYISAAEWAVHVGLSAALLPFMGVYGVAAATLAANVFEKAALFWYARRLGLKVERATHWPIFGAGTAILLLIYLFVSLN